MNSKYSKIMHIMKNYQASFHLNREVKICWIGTP